MTNHTRVSTCTTTVESQNTKTVHVVPTGQSCVRDAATDGSEPSSQNDSIHHRVIIDYLFGNSGQWGVPLREHIIIVQPPI